MIQSSLLNTLTISDMLIFLILAENGQARKEDIGKSDYWNFFGLSVNLGIGKNPWVMGGNHIGYWGFVDRNLGRDEYGGYQVGIGTNLRPLKHFEIYLNLLIGRYSVFLGKQGDSLCGNSIYFSSNGRWHPCSPPLPNDLYFTSKVSLGQVGFRVILPLRRSWI